MTKKNHQYDEQYAQDAPANPAAPAEPTPEERAKELLATMNLAAQHNSPVTPLMLSELAFLLGHITGTTETSSVAA